MKLLPIHQALVISHSPAKPHGYHGRYLWIDVSDARYEWRDWRGAALRNFLGGSGLGTHLLLEHGAAGSDPLSSEALLAFVFSPLVGSPLTTSAKFAVVSKSPLTGRLNDSLASSGFALAGKRTGSDAVAITGRAERPSLLVIDENGVRLVDGSAFWGLDCRAAEQSLREEFGPEYQTAVIGPAGEKLVRYATVSHDGRHAGRGGSGAVLGAKNIKAVLVRGTQRPTWAEPDKLARYAKQLSERSFGPATAKYRELGTASNLLAFNRLKTLPSYNFQQGSFEAAEQLAPETLVKDHTKTRASCVACTIGCEHIYQVGSGESSQGVRLEYENLFALGPLCGIADADTVLRVSRRCDELGIDTISAGGTIAFAMECSELGWLDEPWLRFGRADALAKAIELIGSRQDVGDLLAEGSRRVAESIGHQSIDFAPQVKGLEIPGYDPRALQTMAIGFAVGARGADHNRSGAYEVDFSDQVDRRQVSERGAVLAAETEDKAALMDSLIICKFLRGVFEDFSEEAAAILRLVTGWDCQPAELQTTAERIVTAKKLFNVRAGWTTAEDTLPKRILNQALKDDPQAVLAPKQFKAAVAAYYRHRRWDQNGVPGPELLSQYALD